MATTKKPAAVTTEKEAKPLKAAVAAKPQLVAVTESAPKLEVSKAPAAKKAVAKTAPVKKAAAKAPAAAAPKPVAAKPATKKKTVVTVAREIDPAQRANYIEVAAFYIAERRGFAPGNPEQDYLEAAAEIDRMIAADHFAK